MTICNSGGAEGADTHFAACARAAGHVVRHYSFAGHKSPAYYQDDIYELTQAELNMSDQYLLCANKTLKRTFPTGKTYVDNLLRRNYWQIRDTRAVYAVSLLVDGFVAGGTAWAVQMAIDNRLPNVFLFDQDTKFWYAWYYSLGKFDIILPDLMPKPGTFEVYTGIGSRKIIDDGLKAIEDLYK